MSLLILLIGIILFISLVVVHEFGHFIVARRNGVDVEEFGIFFPPSLFRHKTKAGWTFSLNLIPLGGFVKLKGEHDSDTAPRSFGSASLKVKSKIMAAGVLMNLLTALVLLTILAFIGTPKIIPNQYSVKSDSKIVSQKVLIGAVEQGSPASYAGLKSQDVLTSISGKNGKPIKITSADSLPIITKQFAGQKVNIGYVRNGQPHTTTANLLNSSVVSASLASYSKALQQTKLDCSLVNPPKGYLGISPTQYALQKATWSAPVNAVGLSTQVTALTFQGLGHALGGLGSLIAGAVTGNSTARSNGQCLATSQVAGPVGIFVILKDGSQLGIQFMLFIIAIISLTLAIMNILPIPALDGGRLWITLIAHGLKKPLSSKREEVINAAGFFLIISLVILITIVDVQRFF